MSDEATEIATIDLTRKRVRGEVPHFEGLMRRQRALVECMVWDGCSYRVAAEKLGIPDSTARRWMRFPIIKKALVGEEQVLRQQARSGNIRALLDVRDNSGNSLARVQAAKAIEELAADGMTGRASDGDKPLIVIDLSGSTGAQVGVVQGGAQLGRLRTAQQTIEHSQADAPIRGKATVFRGPPPGTVDDVEPEGGA